MSSGEHERYTLAELAAAGGVSARTIRYYTAEGLLPPPIERGRYAIYSAEHLRRLKLIVTLKAAYLPLAAIREQLAAPGGVQLLPESQPPHAFSEAPPDGGFGFRVTASLGGSSTKPPPETRASSHSVPIGYAALFPYRDDEHTTGDAADDQHGEIWQRITLAAGVELHLRAPVSAQQQERIDALIAQARALLSDEI